MEHQQPSSCAGRGEDAAIDILSGEIPGMAADMGRMESEIAKHMSALSAQAREKAYMDMHGVPEVVAKESPEVIQKGLEELQVEIDKIHDKDAYDQALNQDPKYVEDSDFRLLFLRTDYMNAKMAALRIVRHFQLKRDLFGADNLSKTITQDDLDKEDMQVLYGGRERRLPSKDRAGRHIHLAVVGQHSTMQAELRRSFYNAMTRVLQPDVVVVIYGVGRQAKAVPNRELSWKLIKIREALPVRIVAVHMCQSRSLLNSIFAFAMMTFDTLTRIRIKTHSGTHDEVLSSLRGYGIESDSLPLNGDGRVTDLEDFRKSLVLQRAKERLQYPRRSRIHVPCIFDVLFGKGTPYQNHAGNRQLRSMVSEQQKKYDKSERGEKLVVAQGVVDNIIQNAGMFLKPDGNSWIAVGNDTARTKVSATFRTLRRSSDRSSSSDGHLANDNLRRNRN